MTPGAFTAPSLAACVGVGVGVLVSRPSLVQWPGRVRPAVGLAVGGITGMLTGAIFDTARLAADGSASDRGRLVGRRAVIAATTVGSVTVLGCIGRMVLNHRYERVGRVIDPGFAARPRSSMVSGSAESVVPCETLGREGARFVHTATPPDHIDQVWGTQAETEDSPPIIEPIRVFVGVDSAPDVSGRVALAMAELARTRAFERRVLVVAAPAGSGYANPLPVSVAEIATRGDCATVVVGYGVKPSIVSFDLISLAVATQAALLQEVTEHIARMPPGRRPRLLIYGESLGARVQQGALDPARITGGEPVEGIVETWLDGALWVGTPGGARRDVFRAGLSVAHVCLDRPEQIEGQGQANLWFLEHDADPVVLLASSLLVRRPEWLDDAGRRRDIPRSMKWWPVVTWVQVFVDTVFATKVEPGHFDRKGHDYRADLGAVTCAAYGWQLPVGAHQRLEAVLRAAETARAERIHSSPTTRQS